MFSLLFPLFLVSCFDFMCTVSFHISLRMIMIIIFDIFFCSALSVSLEFLFPSVWVLPFHVRGFPQCLVILNCLFIFRTEVRLTEALWQGLSPVWWGQAGFFLGPPNVSIWTEVLSQGLFIFSKIVQCLAWGVKTLLQLPWEQRERWGLGSHHSSTHADCNYPVFSATPGPDLFC